MNRRIDLEQAFAAIRGASPPDLTTAENVSRLRELQRIVVERLIEERLILGRAAAAGLVVPEADVDAEVARVAEEVQLDPDRLAVELATRGARIDELRTVHRAAITIGQFVAERVLTGQTEEGIDDYEAWLAAAKQAAGARPPPRVTGGSAFALREPLIQGVERSLAVLHLGSGHERHS